MLPVTRLLVARLPILSSLNFTGVILREERSPRYVADAQPIGGVEAVAMFGPIDVVFQVSQLGAIY